MFILHHHDPLQWCSCHLGMYFSWFLILQNLLSECLSKFYDVFWKAFINVDVCFLFQFLGIFQNTLFIFKSIKPANNGAWVVPKLALFLGPILLLLSIYMSISISNLSVILIWVFSHASHVSLGSSFILSIVWDP